MEHLLTNLTASLTELRDTKKLIENSGGKPIAIFNRNQLEGYFVPSAAVEKLYFEQASDDAVMYAMNKRQKQIKPVLDYLKDK